MAQATPIPAAAAAIPAAATIPAVIPPVVRRQGASKIDGFNEVETQPLFYRKRLAAGLLGANTRIDFFTEKKNLAPHITNCEEAGAMPNTAGFRICGIEIVPNATCDATAFKQLLNCSRLLIEVGTKGHERMNQPSVFFGTGIQNGVNGASVPTGIYKLNDGEEINLEPDQPFRVYLQVDDVGATTAQPVDFYLRFWGQKRGRVSLG